MTSTLKEYVFSPETFVTIRLFVPLVPSTVSLKMFYTFVFASISRLVQGVGRCACVSRQLGTHTRGSHVASAPNSSIGAQVGKRIDVRKRPPYSGHFFSYYFLVSSASVMDCVNFVCTRHSTKKPPYPPANQLALG